MDGLALMLAAVLGLAVGALVGGWLVGRMSAERARALQQEFDVLRADLAATREARAQAETAAALARQEAVYARTAIADWEKTRDEFLKSTQASVLTTAQQISSKLLEDHKRETAEAKAAAAAEIKQTTATLQEQVRSVTDGMAQLKGQVAEKAQVLDTVWRALSSPGGAGYFAEIGLANTLKSFGLVQDRDFVLQATLQDGESRKRPDAIVYLPTNAALVIDSKASKHLLDVAEQEGTEREEEAYRGLARTMNQHLKDLVDRDYRNAITAIWRKSGREDQITRILTVMYLPNEAALERLARADRDFMRRAAQAQITPVGPAGLASMIGFASVEISLMRQVANQEKIVVAAERLLEALAVAVGFAGGVGKGIRSAADAYAKLSGSLNGRVLPRARGMVDLGLQPGKPVPANLAAYQVLDLGAETIDGEPNEEPVLLPPRG
jgi:DNA recombination protein RmuC